MNSHLNVVQNSKNKLKYKMRKEIQHLKKKIVDTFTFNINNKKKSKKIKVYNTIDIRRMTHDRIQDIISNNIVSISYLSENKIHHIKIASFNKEFMKLANINLNDIEETPYNIIYLIEKSCDDYILTELYISNIIKLICYK